jgi:nucleoside-diphosphate-sugar epimerase
MTTETRRVLMTGHRGYLGSVMAPYLQSEGFEVVGLDTGYFDDCTLVPDLSIVPAVHKDIRELVAADVAGFDAIVHLAALSNDPIGNLDESWTEGINHRASVRLAELAREGGVRRFLFSSSCIMYGLSDAERCDETTPLDPQTIYAKSKVLSERDISTLATDDFSPIFLRNGTVYGVSPRMRFDTVLNNLVGAAFTTGKVVVLSDGTPWRPVVHVQDVARAFHAVLVAPRSVIHDEAFNTGAEHLNHQIRELAELAASVVPGAEVEVQDQAGADQRTYKADFTKFARTFPDFEFRWNAATGAEDLAASFATIGLTHDQFVDDRFTRLSWLNHLMRSGALDASLRWADTRQAVR